MNVAVVQARMGSTRFPGKVLSKIEDETLLEIIVKRLRKCVNVDKVVVAASNLNTDKPIWELCKKLDYNLYVGNELDVLDRVYQAALINDATSVLRITGDCPLVDPELISELYDFFILGKLDHAGLLTGAGAAQTTGKRFPDGVDSEWIKISALEEAARSSTSLIDREHVTTYIWRNKEMFRSAGLSAQEDFSDIRLTVDTPEDLEMLQNYSKEASLPATQVSFKDISNWIRLQKERPKSQEFIGKENYGMFFSH